MCKEILTFGDIEVEKINFTTMKVPFLRNVNINNILVSNKISSGEKNYKYLTDYLYDHYEIQHYI